MPRLVVAIDGPAGAGKSTVARELASRLGYSLLDTGAIYRAVALLAQRRGLLLTDAPALAELAGRLPIRFAFELGENRVYLEERDVTRELRTPEIGDAASRVSALPAIRAALLGLQRRLGAAGGVIVEGRDVGTVVFPDAPAKFFLTARPEVRARRRCAELRAAGHPVSLEATITELAERDTRDAGRAVAPLRAAADAELIDTSELALGAVVDLLARKVREKALDPRTPGE